MSERRSESQSSVPQLDESAREQTPFRAASSRRRTARVARSALLLGCFGLATQFTCGNNRGDGDQSLDEENPDQPRLVSLTLKPNNDILLVDLNTEGTKPFTVRGLYSDGSSADFTRKVRWSLDNTAVGKFSGPTFKVPFSTKTRSTLPRSLRKSPMVAETLQRWPT